MQMSGLTVQNFVSAAVGMAVAVGVRPRRWPAARASGGSATSSADLVRGTVRVLLPIALVAAVLLVVLGAVQNFAANARRCTTLAGGTQVLTGGPVASQEAIKELGTNGGGFYNVNSAHPFENPTPLSNILEIYLLLAHPVRDGLDLRPDRQGPSPGRRRARR